MIDINTSNLAEQPIALDYRLRQEVGNSIIGVSTGKYGIIVHLQDDATSEAQTNSHTIASGDSVLIVEATKTTIDADGIDETVLTCASLGNDFDYTYWQDGVLVDSGSISDGSLEYSTNTPAVYLFEIREQGGYNTGYVEVMAS